MSIFDGKRLTNDTFKLDVERMRQGWYSDKYFENINRMLTALAAEGYTYRGQYPNLPADFPPENIAVGDIEVEMQWFTRRVGETIVVGVDKALAMLRHCTGYIKDGPSTMEMLSIPMGIRSTCSLCCGCADATATLPCSKRPPWAS
jgi:nicotinate phosphoribosyltransferase